MTRDTYDAHKGTIPGIDMGVAMSHTENTWRQHGACNGLDPSIFFPDSEEASDEAKGICAECMVRVSCLEHALTVREKDGVWGGTTEKERRRIIRQRRRTA